MELWAGDMSFLSTYRCSNLSSPGGGEMDVRWVKILCNLVLSENRCFFFEGMMRESEMRVTCQIFEQMQVLGWSCELLSQIC